MRLIVICVIAIKCSNSTNKESSFPSASDVDPSSSNFNNDLNTKPNDTSDGEGLNQAVAMLSGT